MPRIDHTKLGHGGSAQAPHALGVAHAARRPTRGGSGAAAAPRTASADGHALKGRQAKPGSGAAKA